MRMHGGSGRSNNNICLNTHGFRSVVDVVTFVLMKINEM